MQTQTAQLVRPGALFTWQEREELPILLVEVIRVDMKDRAVICEETLSTDSRRTQAVFDLDVLTDGPFTYVGDVVPDSEHLRNPRVGDLFLYRLEPMQDWPSDGQYVAEVIEIERDGMVVTACTSHVDRVRWYEMWSVGEIGAQFAYGGRVQKGMEGI